MKTIIKYLFVLPLILLGLESIAQNPVQIKGSMRYRNHAVDSMMATPSDTITPTGYFAARPNIVIKDDSVIYVWDVTLQKWRLPRVGSASITWADILGNPYDNPILADSLNVKQQAMPTGVQEEVITGAHTLLNLDSLLNANGYVKISDPIFDTLLSGTSDSLNFINGLYRVGNNVMSYYWQPMWNANRIQTKYVDATQPGNFTFLGWDSTNNVLRWMIPDSANLSNFYTKLQTDSAIAANAGGVPTLQQVTDAGWSTDNLISVNELTWNYNGSQVGILSGADFGGGDRRGIVNLTSGSYTTQFVPNILTGTRQLFLPDKSGTLATLDDITAPSTPTLQQVLTAGANISSSHTTNMGSNYWAFSGANGSVLTTFSIEPGYPLNRMQVYNSSNTYLSEVEVRNGFASINAAKNPTATHLKYFRAYPDSLNIGGYLPVSSSATDSVLTRTPSGQLKVIAKADLSGGSESSSKFGFTGEDATAAENRTFTYSGYALKFIDNTGGGDNSYWRSRAGGWTSDMSFIAGGMNMTTNDYPNYDYSSFIGTTNDGTATNVTLSATSPTSTMTFTMKANSLTVSKGGSGNLSVILTTLPTYADNTAAASLATGSLYKTATGTLMIKY